MFVKRFGTVDPDFIGHVLVLPAVSIGNVAQLSMDLIISNVCVDLVGHIHDADVLPVSGSDAYGEEHRLMTSIDVYQCKDRKMTIIQQRAPIIANRRRAFTERLLEWVQSSGFASVVMLTSADAKNRQDSHMRSLGISLRYVLTNANEKERESLSQLGWEQLEPAHVEYLSEDERQRKENGHVVGGGNTRHMFELCQERAIPLTVMILFCFEGNNTTDSLYFVSWLDDWLKLLPPPNEKTIESSLGRWKPPVSWQGLFGNTFDVSIF